MYLQALINFRHDDPQISHELQSLLLRHRNHILHSPWGGLPELTNGNGEFCADSCPTQAWSMATILAALYQLYMLKPVSV